MLLEMATIIIKSQFNLRQELINTTDSVSRHLMMRQWQKE